MTIDLNRQIQLNPEDPSNTVSIKSVIRYALFNALPNTISRDKAEELYNKVTGAEGDLHLPAEDISILKTTVDSIYARGVSWQFARIVDPPTEN